jgi:RNA polymerase sigma factor FliA
VLSLQDEDGNDEAERLPADGGSDPLRRIEGEAFRAALAEAITALPEREKQVMGLYYQDEMNLKEIGAVLGVTESRVCQIHGQALLRLRARLKDWRGAAE